MSHKEVEYSDFQQYFPFTPTALCIKECARLTVLRQHQCPSPILDVGSGDGLFAKIAFSGAEVWGIDIDAKESRWAQASQAYSQIIIGDVTRAGLPERFFASCVANCSLEHIPDLQAALRTILRSLRPGARAYLFVPNREWAAHFLTVRALRDLGAEFFGQELEDGINRVFKHHHLYDREGWTAQAKQAGFEVDSVEPVLSSATTVAFELFLAPSIAGWVNKRLTTRWTNFPTLRRLGTWPAYAMVQAALKAGDHAPTAEFLVVCRRPEA
jgi:SAM-dependent methyltransferase